MESSRTYEFWRLPGFICQNRSGATRDEFLFDCDSNEIHWFAARSSAQSTSELLVVLYIIYTNLSAKCQQWSVNSNSSIQKIPNQTSNNARIANSLKCTSNSNLLRDRAATLLAPASKTNQIVPIRSVTIGVEPSPATNIPVERGIDYFRNKITSIFNKAALSHRRESLWDRLIEFRSNYCSSSRPEISPINIAEFQTLLDSCVGEEKTELPLITSLLQRVFLNKAQTEQLTHFLRNKYGSQYVLLTSSPMDYLVIFQNRAPQHSNAFLVLVHRSDPKNFTSYLVKHQHDIDCKSFIQTFTERISYFLWECLF